MIKFLLVLLACAILSCAGTNKNHPDKNEQAIYNLALDSTTRSDTLLRFRSTMSPIKYDKKLDSIYPVLKTNEVFVVINHKTDTINAEDSASLLSNPAWYKDSAIRIKEAMNNLIDNNMDDTLKVSNFSTSFNCKIFSDRELPEEIGKKFGLISFSKIGFSLDKRFAVVCVNYYYGKKLGRGFIMFFEKLKGNWRVLRIENTWIY